MINKKNDLIFLQNILSFWDKIDREQQNKIIENTVNISYLKGQNIYNPTKECLSIILIKKGELRTYILSEEGKEITFLG